MIVDCDRCEVRGLACDDCVVSVLLGPPHHDSLADDECRAVDVLATSGLVPPLRYREPPRRPRGGDGPDEGGAWASERAG